MDAEIHVVRTPTPPVRPPAVETAAPDAFTVDQISNLHTHFKGDHTFL